MHRIDSIGIHGQMGSNDRLLKWWGVEIESGDIDGTLSFLGFELLGWLLVIHSPLKVRLFDGQFWIFTFVSSILAAFRNTSLMIPRNSITRSE